ncbi:[NiFe] hydrogenase diaphorase moiety small subunit [Rhodobacter aestuarii]|uniref:[NiFe] hydrogenase diaphorase moiety small subunit n=1 Tax=Rhodobacter aestuarii TaxID=453582 RepID=A0A1N7KZS9_9RHOB|nr:2Fe-2S iron-sulfur cluster-binding protein [Rhodobacter aestuarii]PTV95477.1 [NiFe] hydrogenase diaphorase moiety small subunit [Rhodobacter aestuarii]SIS67085.1 [NiFe] hydrogenase diaphorase moiety small subunit [Rhodobacter aestuarii]
MSIRNSFTIDGERVDFEPGQSILQAALAAGVFIPHLCFHPEFSAHGSCKLCTVVVNGRNGSACTIAAMPGQEVRSDTPELNQRRRMLLQMLFVEGNHFCPGCEKSGNCKLQAMAYELEMFNDHFQHFFPDRGPVDASHPEVMLDRNRCIQCELCVRASRDIDGKEVFSLAGRGPASHLVVNAASGLLGDTPFAATDKAAEVCPVGAIMVKRVGFTAPIGRRKYDGASIRDQIEHPAPAQEG